MSASALCGRLTCGSPRLLPQRLLLSLSAGAVIEDMLPRLVPVQASPALGCGLVPRPFQVLAGEAVTRLQLVELGGKPLGTTDHNSIRPLLGRRPVFSAGLLDLLPSAGLQPTSLPKPPT